MTLIRLAKGRVFGATFLLPAVVPIDVHIMAGKQLDSAGGILANEKPILTLRQARRLLGKQTSNSIDDVDLSGMIGAMSSLAESLINDNSVPKNGQVV